ncbi:MAG: hypothetical protein V7727_07655 [Sneathiella sp.]
MFTRNEKYGQALHLQYGSTPNTVVRAVANKTSIAKNIVSFFKSRRKANEITAETNCLDMTMDQAFINRAVLQELRNTDAAANENGAAHLQEEIA